MSTTTKRTFVCYVENKPGALNHVASMFRRRAYNIESLNVGHTHVSGISRMTIVVHADEDQAKRIEANLYKMVNVLRVEDITFRPVVQRDLALIRVKASAEQRAQVMQLCEVFRARIVDVAIDTVMVEITGTEDKIDGLLSVLEPFGITEMVRTGIVAMVRGSESSGTGLADLGTDPATLRVA
jgi:acetolactate synthase I/III small subunit